MNWIWTIFFVLVHIAVIILFGTWNRARLGHFEVDDGSTLRCVRILMTWIACGVCILAIVSSVFA